MTVENITVAKLRDYETNPLAIPLGDTFVVKDIAANIESLTPTDISKAPGSVVSIAVTNGSVGFTVIQAVALENAAFPAVGHSAVTVLSGDTVTIVDTEEQIQTLGANQVDGLAAIGVTAITANDLSPISVVDYVSDVATVNNGTFTFNGYVNITDTAANIQKLTPAEIGDAKTIGLGQITSTDPSVVLTVAQALALGNSLVSVAVPSGGTVTIADTAANLTNLTTTQIAALHFVGVTAIAGASQVVTSGSGLVFNNTFGSDVSTAYQLAVFTAEKFYQSQFINPVTIDLTFGTLSLGSGGNVAKNFPSGPTVSYSALSSALASRAMTPDQLAAVASLPAADISGGSGFFITDALAQALGLSTGPATETIDLNSSLSYFYNQIPVVGEVDAVAEIEHEISEAMGRLGGLGLSSSGNWSIMDLFRYSSAGTRDLTGGGDRLPAYFSVDGTTLLTQFNNPVQYPGDAADWNPFPGSSLPTNVTGGWDAYGAGNLDSLGIVTPTDLAVMNILGYIPSFTAAEIEALTPAGMAKLTFDGITSLSATDTSVVLTMTQAEAFETAKIRVSAPAGDTVTLAGLTAADVEALLPGQIAALVSIGVTVISATGGSVALTADQVLELETGPILVTAPAHDGVFLSDTAANLAILTPTEINALPSIGVTAIVKPPAGTLFFDGVDANGNNALFVSDGSAGGTHELVGVNGIAGDVVAANPITVFDGKLLFFGNDLYGNAGLWASDGTAAGTHQLSGITNAASAAQGGLNPKDFTVFGNEVLFNGNDLYGNAGLWAYDGTVAGTHELSGITNAASAAQGGLNPQDLTVFGNEVLFDGTDANGTVGLWKTDGTAAGTSEIVAGTPGQNFYASGMTVFAGKVVFSGADGGLWETDGTAAGTTEIASAGSSIGIFNGNSLSFNGTSFVVPTGGIQPYSIAVVDGQLLFGGSAQYEYQGAPTTAQYLESFNGTSIQIVSALAPAGPIVPFTTSAGSPGGPVEEGFFSSMGGLYSYNTSGSTDLVVNAYENLDPRDLTVAFGDLFFNGTTVNGASVGGLTNDLYMSYGTIVYVPTDKNYFGITATLDLAANITGADATGIGLNPQDLMTFNGSVYFNGVDAQGKQGLFVLSGPFLKPSALFGSELTGISGANPNGLNPQDLTAMTPVSITVGQLLIYLADPSANMVPPGEDYVVIDTAYNIESLTPAQITAAKALGVNKIEAVDNGVELTVAQAVALEDPVSVTAPAGDTVIIADTAADIVAMTAAQLTSLTAIGVTAITATDTSVTLTVAQALALEDPIAVTVPAGDTVTIADTAADIESLTPAEIAALAATGVTAIRATDGSVVFSPAQAGALAPTSLPVTAPPGDTVTTSVIVNLTAVQIEQLTEFAAIVASGYTTIAASDTSVALTAAAAVHYEDNSLRITAPTGHTVTIADTAYDINRELTPGVIAALPSIGVSAIAASGASVVFTVAQALALEGAALGVTVPVPDTVSIADTAANIAALTSAQIAALSAVGVSAIATTDTKVGFTVAQALALEGAAVNVTVANSGYPDFNRVTVTDTAAAIGALTPSQISKLPAIGASELTVTDASLAITFAQAEALQTASVHLTVPSNDTLTIADSAANIEAGLASFVTAIQQSQQPLFSSIGVYTLAATDTSVALTLTEALDLHNSYGDLFRITAPTGHTVSVLDIPANIDTYIDSLTTAQSNALSALGVSALGATASNQLTVAEAVALEGTALVATAPLGDTVTVSDTAANIATLTPGQIAGVPATGVSAIAATDASVQFTVAQALALEGTSLVVTAPPGDTVTVADSEAQIDTLTPQQIAALPAIGVSAIDVASLAGFGPITIDGGITLSVAGTVSPNQTIAFSGAGGVLSLADAIDMKGTVTGFAPGDTIDLTGAAQDPTATANLVGGNVLQIVEASGTYQIGFAQGVFSENFTVGADLGGGTTVGMVQVPLTSYAAVSAGETVYGATVGNGGTADVQAGGTFIGGTIGSFGTLEVESGGTVSGATIGGGTLDVMSGGTAGGSITFAVGAGGTLQIDGASLPTDPSLMIGGVISGFAPGDTIDLTGISYDSSGHVTMLSGDEMQIVENGTTYDLQLNSAQNFAGDFFHLASDGAFGTDLTEDGTPCYCRGTLILTDTGEVRVEDLREGDLAITGIDGSLAPVVWIGHREVDCARHPDPKSVWPVRIKAGAFGRGLPKRALTLSLDHAVHINEVLVPVKHLINGTTIAQVRVDRVTYYHVELERHDVLYADGMPAESYLDVGDRANFANGGAVVRLHIDLAHHWEAGGCAPLVIYGPELEGVKAVVEAQEKALAKSTARKRALGHAFKAEVLRRARPPVHTRNKPAA